MANTFIKSIKTIAQSLINDAGFDKTRTGQILFVNTNKNTYTVKVDGYIYQNVKTVNDATYNVGDMVKIVIPCNQATQVYIESSVLSNTSLGNQVANATSLAEEAQHIAESKNKTYYQAEAPTEGMTENDIWIDTDDDNNMYIWDGDAWVFAGTTDVIYYATSSTVADATIKVATVTPSVSNFSLVVGMQVMVNFTVNNTAYPAQLNVNNTGNIEIRYNGASLNNSTRSYIAANKPVGFVYDGTYWQLTGKFSDDNTYDRIRYNIALTATGAISSGVLATINSNNNIVKLTNGLSFDVNKPVLYIGTAYTATALSQSNNYTMYGVAFNYANTMSGFSGTAGLPVYLVGTLSGSTFTIDSTTMFTTTTPLTADGKIYMLLGRLTTTNNGTLSADHPLFAYGTNGFSSYAPRTAIGQVEISVNSISYPNQTAQLQAILFVDGVRTNPTGYQWSFTKLINNTPVTTDISGATSATLNITSASADGAGLGATYNCVVTW